MLTPSRTRSRSFQTAGRDPYPGSPMVLIINPCIKSNEMDRAASKATRSETIARVKPRTMVDRLRLKGAVETRLVANCAPEEIADGSSKRRGTGLG
jgi:hypothetical protein